MPAVITHANQQSPPGAGGPWPVRFAAHQAGRPPGRACALLLLAAAKAKQASKRLLRPFAAARFVGQQSA